MSDRLKELIRQRALLTEHLAWLEREIASAELAAPGSPAPGPVVALPGPEVPAASTVAPPPQPHSPDVEALFDRLRSEEKGKGQFSKQGCWVVFGALLLLGLVAVSALIFMRYR